MTDVPSTNEKVAKRVPSNEGKIVGEAATPPEARLVHSDKTPTRRSIRDLALFNVAIDSKLRGCDVVALKVDDIAPSGYGPIEPVSARRRPVVPSNSNLPATRQALDDYLRTTGKKPGDRLFTGRKGRTAA